MPRHNFAGRRRNADKGPVKFLINKAHGLKKGPVGSAGYALGNRIASHTKLL
jgi:hypothetical protein